MSFKDSKKLATTANSAELTSIAELAVDTEEVYTQLNGYESYPMYRDNKYSSVDNNKNITMDISQINITQESNSQYIPFEMPRFYDGIDLSTMTISIRYADRLGGTGNECNVVNVEVSDSHIRFGWLIDDKLTAIAGDYIFEIRAVGKVGNLTYAWSTRPNGRINVLQGIDANVLKPDGTSENDWNGWYTKYEVTMSNYVDQAKTAAESAKRSADSVNQDVIRNQVRSDIQAEIENNYYKKTYIDEEITSLNNAIGSIDSLKNLDATYEESTGKLILKDTTKGENGILATPIINGLSKLRVTYTVENGKGVLTFKNGETNVVTTVELSSIDPSDDWTNKNITPILNRVSSLENSKTEIENSISQNTATISTLTSDVSELEKTTGTLSQNIDTNKEDVSLLKKDVSTLKETTQTLSNSVSDTSNDIKIMKQSINGYDQQFNDMNSGITDIQSQIDELKKNPAASEYDVNYEENIFKWIKNGEVLKQFKIEGGGGGGSDTSTITIERITDASAVFLLNETAIIEYTFSSVDNTGDTTGDGTATWKVGNSLVATTTVNQGKNRFNITEYLTTGINSIRLSITDSFGTLSTKTWTITIVEFKLESTFDDSLFYSDEVPFRYTPYGNINKKIHLILDDKELTTIDTQASGRQMSYTIPAQTHGSHLLKAYMTATINNKAITSNIIYKDIICVNPSNRTPIIGCSMVEFSAQQYHTTSIKYIVYDPDHNPATVKLSIDGNTVSTLSVGRTVQTWSYKSSDIGSHDLTISCRKVTKILKATITKLDIDVNPVTANLAFDFNPVGYSNNDSNRLWRDKNHPEVSLAVSDNFDWDNGGYQIDNDGNQYFCVKAGSSATISYKLFEKDPKQTGSEFKIIFKTTNVRDSSATFLSCLDGSDNSNVGLEMNVHEAYVRTSTNSLYFPYSEEDIIEYEYNINTLDTKNTSATSILMTYEDGVGGRPIIYDNTHRLHQYTPTEINIGSDDCDIYIYRMKAYTASLTDSDILSNYIADARDSDEMISRYNRNQIYNENNALTPDSVANACPYLRVIKIEAPHFTNDKKDFVKGTSMQCIYKNGDSVLDNWTFRNCYHAGQGTTSNEYGFAARNIDVIACFDGIHQVNSKIKLDPDYKTELTLGDGTKYSDGTGKISLTRNSVPNNWFNFKVNVASSEMANNALLQKRFNDYLPYKTPGTRRDHKVKNSMEFVNCVIFIKENDPDVSTHREFKDTDWHFYSLGNIGDSKKTDVTRAYNPDDMKEFCIEISDNTLPNSAFQTGVANPDGTMKYPISKDEWKAGNTAYDNLYNNWDGSFEFRYDCCGDSKDGQAISSNEEKNKIRTKNKQIWRDFYEFVITSSDKDFVDHLGDWMIEDAALYLYLFTLRYTMIDNRAKNVFPHWAKHFMSTAEAASAGDDAKNYTIDDSKAAINNGYRFDFWDYDNDTGIGINNSGELTMSYGKEDTDYKTEGKPSSGYIFNAAESVLWCRIRDLMQSRLRNLYQSVDSNCWSAEHLINEFDAWQEQFPEELWRLHYERLYLRTYQAGTVRFLQEMMNGRKKYQRRQWERDQHAYMGTKFVHTDVKSDQIMFRCNTPKNVVVKPDYTLRIIPYSDMYISVLYGNSANPTQIRAKAGQEYEITTNLTNMDDTAVLIYCASRIQALNDLSACYIHDNDFSKASKLRTLIIGNNTEGYQNTFLTTLNMGNNTLLETLDIKNCPNLTGSINLAACGNLINLYAQGTIITSVALANHGKIKHVYLPETINTLSFKNLKDLTDLNVASYKNLETLVCEDSVVDSLRIIKTVIDTIKTVSIRGINWSLDNTDILNKLAKCAGIDDNGYNTEQSVLTGTVHVPVIRQEELKLYSGTTDTTGIWPDLEVIYDSMITQFKVTFVNDDENHTVLDVQYVDKGSNAVDPITREENPIAIPTKESTIQYEYTYRNWDGVLTSIFADRTITAVYTSSIRKYTITYLSKGYDYPLYTTTAPYGSIVEYKGDIEVPVYTGEESAYKFYLFKGWDESGYVTGNKTINAVFDTCEYRNGYFDGRDLETMTPVEIYTLMKMGKETEVLSEKDSTALQLGIDCSFNDIPEHEIITTPKVFDGTNYVDTGLKLMKKDSSFTIAIDYVFDQDNKNNATLAQCFQGDGSNGFKLYYRQGVKMLWGTDTIDPSIVNNREIVILRHIAGDEKVYVYTSNMANNEVSSQTMTAVRVPEHEYSFVLGCSKADDGTYEQYAKGTVYWCKIWDADLGEEQCKNLASWIHETIPMQAAKFGDQKEYYLADGSSKRANITFVAANLLGVKHSFSNQSTGGWAKASLNTWLNARLIKAISPQWKALIKPVKVKGYTGDKDNTITESVCNFYIPSAYEVDVSQSSSPYDSEADNPISYMVTNDDRKRATTTTPDVYETYFTRSPSSEISGYVKNVNQEGYLDSYMWPTNTAGVLLMFSIFADKLK